jgi:hypothetical protein
MHRLHHLELNAVTPFGMAAIDLFFNLVYGVHHV